MGLRALAVLCVAALLVVCVAADTKNKVTGLPGANANILNFDQYTGYVTVNSSSGGNIFYWLFEAYTGASTAPLVLWMTGGPGCSSELAIFQENGPFSINDDLTLSANPYTWNTEFNVLYVDQPVGTGFSYVTNPDGYVANITQFADDMYTFLQGFFALFPEYQGRPFFVTGESYAGHYVPALSAKIVRENAQNPNSKINYIGSAVGNGMTDPLVQYGSYGDYAYSHGLIDMQTLQQIQGIYLKCQALLESGDIAQASQICDSIMTVISNEAGPFNVYDVRLTCPSSVPLCYASLQYVQDYIAQPALLQALNVSPNANWTMCNNDVYNAISGAWFTRNTQDVAFVLDSGYRFMIYDGNMGFICNFMGNEAWVRDMQWSGQAAYFTAPREIWMVNNNIAGYAKSAKTLTLVVVNNAGHMVPMDQPQNALDMITRFVNNKPFNN